MDGQPLFWFGDVTREGEMDWHRGRASGVREQSKTFRKDVLRTWAQVGKISLSWIDEENGAGGRLEQWRHFVLSPFERRLSISRMWSVWPRAKRCFLMSTAVIGILRFFLLPRSRCHVPAEVVSEPARGAFR